ncbi:Cell division protein FtsZ 1 [Candidatus Bilamarchaeum dharawalense]|uniref:Cell division protein FtsZ n=1 Tax=Candidatus Bilamarchaeum dharawalense TaxID=2885759 RepID=A0A5E4LWR1_9ARCH|nr:Cell division protein FtsZ 1 [Candidatus Bilamarchaeum dharawalense]
MFDDIIKAAKEGNPQPTAPTKEDSEPSQVRIAVLGVGGAGCNCVNRIYNGDIKSAKTIAINTDGKHLNMIGAHKKILIGKTITRGLGAGGDIAIAKKCADADRDLLKKEIGENELVFLCAGMGGGTGGGAAPVIAQIAKEQGAIVVAMVTYPFALERVRIKKAQHSLQELVKVCDTVVVIDNNRLAAYAPNLPINKAFELADSITTRAVTGISDTIIFPSLMNVDYADVKTVMENGGLSMISLGHGSGHTKIEDVAKDTLEHPLLDVNYEGAKGCLLHIEGGPDLTLGDAIKAGELVTKSFDESANIKIGARISPTQRDAISVTAIITGVKSPYILGKGPEHSDEGSSGFGRSSDELEYL